MPNSIPPSPLSRRRFVQASAAGAVALAGATAWADDSAKKENYIDAHVHVWTPDTKAYPLAQGFKKEDMQPPSFTPEQLFAHCRPHGVERIVLIQMSFYRYDNSYMLDMMAKHRGVFSGVAVIDEDEQPAATMRKLSRLGVRGFRIRPGDQSPDAWLKSEGMKAMWQCGGEDGLAMCHLINPEYLPAVDRMCAAHPETPVVIDHFARIGIDGVVRQADLDNLCRLAKHRNTSVKVSAFYALGKKMAPYTDLGPMIRRLLDAFGPERLMWASDCPFQVVDGHKYGPSIDLIKEKLDFLSEGDRSWLLGKTAERVFFS